MARTGLRCKFCGGHSIVLMGTTVEDGGWFICDECDDAFDVSPIELGEWIAGGFDG